MGSVVGKIEAALEGIAWTFGIFEAGEAGTSEASQLIIPRRLFL
jgi:hypothetical protein